MSASISTRHKNLGMEFLKKTAGYITGATGEYVREVMPITTSTITGARETLNKIQSTFANTSSAILPKNRQLNVQTGFRSISNWFLQKEDDYQSYGDIDAQLDFDVDSDNSEIAQAQISELGKNANQISAAVTESSHKLVESQIAATANMLTAIDRQIAVISSGFDTTNTTLNKILEVLTTNSATLIEATIAASEKKNENYNNNMIRSGKFNMSDYSNMIGKNFKNSEIAMIASLLPMLVKNVSPQDLIKFGIGAGLDKLAPKLKGNMKALDDAVNKTVMDSLIRLGERGNEFGIVGTMAKLFGIDSTRKTADTRRSSIEVKSIPFDTITKEAVTNAIPGYLRKILVAVGGDDTIYDYRSRSFKNGSQIKREYTDMSAGKYNIYSASKGIQKAVGTDEFGSMLYDLMLNELGSISESGGNTRNVIKSFQNKGSAEDFIMSKVLRGIPLSKPEKARAIQIAENLSVATDGFGAGELMSHMAKSNVSRNERTSNYIDQADKYNIDLSDIRDNHRADAKNIAAAYGKMMLDGKLRMVSSSEVSSKATTANLTGVNYTNMALYEIYRRLNEGLNVFQVGSKDLREDPFKKFGDDYLTRPGGYKAKNINDVANKQSHSLVSSSISGNDDPNLLQNQENKDGTNETLTKGERFSRWGKKRGGNLAKAVFSGSVEDVRDAFGAMVKDVTQIAGEESKKGLSYINKTFGNVSGFLKHKLFGTEYSYESGTDDEGKPITKKIQKNKQGGVFGWITDGVKNSFSDAKENTSKWLSSVKSYFDFEDTDGDPEEKKVAGKRKKFLATSIGAFAGAGILGGPIGLLVGSIAGNAISALGIGKRIKGLLFGHDAETGKPTGLISTAADAILSPIKFQLGKTIALAGGVLKKNVFGPLADLGLAMKDRMTNHIDSMFKKASDFLLKPFKEFGKRALKGLGNLAMKGIGALSNLGTTTIPGKLARGALNIGGAMAGGLQTGVAIGIGRNSFHTLKRDEKYTIKAGEAYMDQDGNKQHADQDMVVTGRDGIKVSTNAYNKLRRENRKSEVAKDIEDSGYYQSGRGALGKIKGFFGGDYNKWHEQDLLRRQNRRGKLSSYTSEEVSIGEVAESSSEVAKNTDKISSDTSSLAKTVKTIDTRLESIIQVLGGELSNDQEATSSIGYDDATIPLSEISIPSIDHEDNEVSEISKVSKVSEVSESRDFVQSLSGAASSVVAASGDVSDEENKEVISIAKSGMSENPNKETVLSKFQNLINFNKKTKKTGNNEEEEKQSGLSKVMSFASGILGGVGGMLSGLPGALPIIAPAVLGIALLKKLGLTDQIIGWFKDTAMPWVTDKAIPGIANFIKQDIVPAVAEIAPTIVSSVVEIAGAIWKEVPPWLQISLVGLAAAKGFDALSSTVSTAKSIAKGVGTAVNWVKGAAGVAGAVEASTAAATISGGSAMLSGLGTAAAAALPIALPLLAAAGIGTMIYTATAPSDEMKAQEDFIELSDGKTVIGRESWEKGILPDHVKNDPELMKEVSEKAKAAKWGISGISEKNIGNRRAWDFGANLMMENRTNDDDRSVVMDLGKGVKQNVGTTLDEWDTYSPTKQKKLIEEMYEQKQSMFLGTSDSIALKAYKLGLRANGKEIKNIDKEKADIISALLFDIVHREIGEGYQRDRKALVNPVGSGYLNDQFRMFSEMEKVERDKYIKMLEEQLDGMHNSAGIEQYVQKSYEKNYKYDGMTGPHPDLYESVNSSAISGELPTGGPTDNSDSGISKPTDTSDQTINTTPGGNPLNKPFKVTSTFGPRGYPKYDTHDGIDIIPASGTGPTEVGARFAGTVIHVKSNVPDTDTAYKDAKGKWQYNGANDAGNIVTIKSDDGTIIKNMHLKSGSIPSNIKNNARVNIGDKIGEMGTTGWSTGPHLHYQLEDSSGKPYNPYSSVTGGKQISSFVNNGTTSTSTVSDSGTYQNDAPTDSSSKTGFALFMERISEFGNSLLYKITGGLAGSLTKEDEPPVSTLSPEYSYTTSDGQRVTLIGDGPNTAVSQLDINTPIELLTNTQVDGIMRTATVAVVLDLKSGISYKIIWGGPPKTTHTDYTTLTPTDTEKKQSALAYDHGKWPDWSPRPCILKMAGHQIAIGTNNYPHGNRIHGCNPGESMPNMSNNKVDGKWPLGGHFCMYYKDSSKSKNDTDENPSDHQKAAQEAYNIATAMIEQLKKNQEVAASIKDGDKSSLWSYLKTKGFSDTAISGILGCWDAESKNTAKRIESDYLVPGGADYDKLVNDRQAMNDYTNNIVFGNNNRVDKKAYRGEDNNLYPGLGYAQWTGPRGQKLLEYAKSKGMSWAAPATQLDFMDQELRDINGPFKSNDENKDILTLLSKAKTPEDAAKVWAMKYEGAQEYHLPPRMESAKKLYNEYNGKFDSLIEDGSPTKKDPFTTNAPVGGGYGGSSISTNQSHFSRRSPVRNVGGGSSINTQRRSSTTANMKPIDNYDDYDTGVGGDSIPNLPTNNNPNQQVALLLGQAVELLRAINNNTGESSDLLDSLNKKDFVDKGLRDSISSLPKQKKRTPTPTNHGNTRTIASMARP